MVNRAIDIVAEKMNPKKVVVEGEEEEKEEEEDREEDHVDPKML